MNPGDPSEFITGLHGDCGETALADAIAAVQRRSVNAPADILGIVDWLKARHESDNAGATTLQALADYSRQHGLRVATELDYHGDQAIPFNVWHNLLLAYAGTNPIVLELANGQALHDLTTGAHDETNLHYHFICVIGKQIEGYVCCDGDNPKAGQGRYQIYNVGTLIAAQPCGVLILR